jgi:hypothetical protein
VAVADCGTVTVSDCWTVPAAECGMFTVSRSECVFIYLFCLVAALLPVHIHFRLCLQPKQLASSSNSVRIASVYYY